MGKRYTAVGTMLFFDRSSSKDDDVRRAVKESIIAVTERVRRFAEQLLKLEAAERRDEPQASSDPFLVCERLRVPLSTLAGKAGFRALVSRSLALAKAEDPRFSALSVGEEGCVEGFERISPPLSGEEIAAGEAVLVACLVDLLRTFLGESLMLRLIHDVWPEAAFTDTGSGKETTA